MIEDFYVLPKKQADALREAIVAAAFAMTDEKLLLPSNRLTADATEKILQATIAAIADRSSWNRSPKTEH